MFLCRRGLLSTSDNSGEKGNPLLNQTVFNSELLHSASLGAFHASGYIRERFVPFRNLCWSEWKKNLYGGNVSMLQKESDTPYTFQRARFIYFDVSSLGSEFVAGREGLRIFFHSTSISTAPITFLPHPLILGRGGEGKKPIKITILCLQICRSFSLMKDA